MMDKLHLDWLKNKLQMDDNSFRNSETYKLLKQELTIKGYWRAKERGNPKKGYKVMKEKINNPDE